MHVVAAVSVTETAPPVSIVQLAKLLIAVEVPVIVSVCAAPSVATTGDPDPLKARFSKAQLFKIARAELLSDTPLTCTTGAEREGVPEGMILTEVSANDPLKARKSGCERDGSEKEIMSKVITASACDGVMRKCAVMDWSSSTSLTTVSCPVTVKVVDIVFESVSGVCIPANSVTLLIVLPAFSRAL